MEESELRCPLCGLPCGPQIFYADQVREYYRCGQCFLIFVPPLYFLSSVKEKEEYDKHRNSPDDVGYRSFLSHLYTPLLARLAPGSSGLDFGSGPGPTLSVMFEEAGHSMAIYDPFYAPDKRVLAREYDFVTASEVVEHFHNPATDLELLWSLLKSGGYLGIMTGLALDSNAFAGWRYKDDHSHVSFFSRETLGWLAEKWQAEWTILERNVCLFQKTHHELR